MKAIPLSKSFDLKSSYEKRLAEQKKQLRQASQLYERQFLNEMVRAMRNTVNTQGGALKKSFSEKLYQGQLDDHYVDSWSKTGGVGFADLIYNQLMERYFSVKPNLGKPQGPMDIKSQKQLKIKSIENSKNGQKASQTFLIQPESEKGIQDVKSPWPGKVKGVYKTMEGAQVIELNHNLNGALSQQEESTSQQNLSSKIVYPGHGIGLKVGDELYAGQKVGTYDPQQGILAWNVRKI